MSGRTVLVTGTDTDIGKTVAATWIASVLAAGRRLALVKAAQTGTTDPARDGDEAFYRRALAGLAAAPVTIVTAATFPEPLAPSIAAERAGTPLDFAALVARCREIAATHDLTLIEGAGGLLVTLTESSDHSQDTDYAGLARELDASLVLVIRPALGTLNHTMLSVEAAERRGLHVECLVVSGYPDGAGVVERENLRFLRRRYPALPLLVLRQADLDRPDPLAGLRPRVLGEPPPLLAGIAIEPFDTAELER